MVLGVGARNRTPGQPKDTTRNIEETGEFTINLVNEPMVSAMAVCAIEFPAEVDELAESGLDTTASLTVSPPRISAAPVQIECKRRLALSMGGAGRTLIIGEVTAMHVAEYLIDEATLRIDQPNLKLVGRAGSGGWYMRTTDMFQIKEPTLEEWES